MKFLNLKEDNTIKTIRSQKGGKEKRIRTHPIEIETDVILVIVLAVERQVDSGLVDTSGSGKLAIGL